MPALSPAFLPLLSLYIHVPWCIKKCPYCDFNSHTLPANTPFAAYTDALIADAAAQLPFVSGRQIASVFIGGGTPSLLPVGEYQRLFAALRTLFDFSKTCEITLEANPATLEHAPFEQYLAVGINRLSLGVQSFDDDALRVLGRIHTKNHVISAITQAQQAGFCRLNVDLMYGLPGQTQKLALYDVQMAQNLGASHISWYQLTIESNTVFYRKPPNLPDEQTLDAIEAVGRAALLEADFVNYEVSAWVSPTDTPCRHNVNYWQFGDYLAIGAGGHGKVTLANTLEVDRQDLPEGFAYGGIYRFSKSRLPKDYLTYEHYPKFVGVHPIPRRALVAEYMMNALRLRAGTTLENFRHTTGLDKEALLPAWHLLQRRGLLVADDRRIAPTALGYRYVNRVIQDFL